MSVNKNQGHWQERPLCILGATGSIGTSTLAIAKECNIPVHTLTAHSSAEELAKRARDIGAKRIVIGREDLFETCKKLVSGTEIKVLAGPEALNEVSADEHCPCIMTAIVGAAGLPATLAAVEAGKRVCIANKEPLVMAGELIMQRARECGAEILPVDSEHSAIFQCLAGHPTESVREILLTGSGGPFRRVEDLSSVTKAQALKHPNWNMGAKITIDSASLMNKSLELIEARWLFNIEVDRIRILIHPESVIHSMVSFVDGSVMAQLGVPDMRTPIIHALSYPDHIKASIPVPDFTKIAQLNFEDPDHERFPSIQQAYHAAKDGGILPVVMNAANEIAVEAFLADKIRFIDIFSHVEKAMNNMPSHLNPNMNDIISYDHEVRERFAI